MDGFYWMIRFSSSHLQALRCKKREERSTEESQFLPTDDNYLCWAEHENGQQLMVALS